MGWLEASQPAGAWHQPKTATYPPEFRDSRAGDRVSLLREQDQVKRGSQIDQRRPMRRSTNTIHTKARLEASSYLEQSIQCQPWSDHTNLAPTSEQNYINVIFTTLKLGNIGLPDT